MKCENIPKDIDSNYAAHLYQHLQFSIEILQKFIEQSHSSKETTKIKEQLKKFLKFTINFNVTRILNDYWHLPSLKYKFISDFLILMGRTLQTAKPLISFFNISMQ